MLYMFCLVLGYAAVVPIFPITNTLVDVVVVASSLID